MTDREEKWEARYNREADRFTERPVRTTGKWVAIVVAVVVGFTLLFSVLGFVGSWFDAGKDIVSPTNVKEQYRAVIEDYQSLEAAAQNYCAAKQSHGGAAEALVEDPAFAYAAQYRRIVIDYNRRQQNLFEAELVGPKGYPDTAPTLLESVRRLC